MIWTRTLIAPEAVRLHDVTLRTYQIHGDEAKMAIPPRIYKTEVLPLTPTAGPTPTSTPVPTPTVTPTPFVKTPLGTTLVEGAFTIVAALIGLVGVYLGRERLPYINTRASRQPRLKRLYSNLAYWRSRPPITGLLSCR